MRLRLGDGIAYYSLAVSEIKYQLKHNAIVCDPGWSPLGHQEAQAMYLGTYSRLRLHTRDFARDIFRHLQTRA